MGKGTEIRAVIIDVDGTLTDGSIHISGTGELFKSFYSRDGIGILVAIKNGIQPVILTSRKSKIVDQRAKELGIQYVLQGFGSKKADGVLAISKQLNIPLKQIAYIGDDINDLEAMKLCDVTACPCDAESKIIEYVDYVCSKKGGGGAVREFIEYLLGEKFVYS